MFNKKKGLIQKEMDELNKFKKHKESLLQYIKNSVCILKDFFVPHTHNSHKPKILRTKSLAVIVLSAIILKLSLFSCIFLMDPFQGYMSQEVIDQVLVLINKDRTAQNLSPLAMNNTLSNAANAKANDMITNNYFEHYSPNGKKPWDFINRTEYKYIFVGENLAMNFTTAKSVHNALMKSPTHKKNIMNPKYTEIGLAMLNGDINDKNTNVLVQHFATRKTITPSPVIAKISTTPIKPVIPTPIIKNPEPIKVLASETNKPKPIIQKPVEIKKPTPVIQEKITPSATTEVQETHIKQTNKITVTTKIPEISTPEEIQILNKKLEQNIVSEVKNFKNIDDKKIIVSARVINIINNTLLTMFVLMIVSLLLNIFIKIKIQHKPAIMQTLLVIMFIGSLAYFKFELLESGILNILLT